MGRRIKKLNTSVCEQTFSWFRGYAKMLNEMQPLRHRFLVLYFCKLHNENVDAGTAAEYLNEYTPFKPAKKSKRSYPCVKKAMKVKATKKAMKVKKTVLKK